MTQSTAAICKNCGALLPLGAGASAADACPACARPIDPDVTLHPGPDPVLTASAVEMPARLPVGALASVGAVCALMGVALGVWLGGRRQPPAPAPELRLPALPPPRPAYQPPAPRQYFPAPGPSGGLPSLPPARISPPIRPTPNTQRREWQPRWHTPPRARRPSAPPPPPLEAAARPPLKAPDMATVRVTNPSDRSVEVSLSGKETQQGVVGPRAVIDLLVPPGRYDVTLRGPSRTQRFHDAPLTEGDVLTLVYSESTPR